MLVEGGVGLVVQLLERVLVPFEVNSEVAAARREPENEHGGTEPPSECMRNYVK
jgi:hypothetical protein